MGGADYSAPPMTTLRRDLRIDRRKRRSVIAFMHAEKIKPEINTLLIISASLFDSGILFRFKGRADFPPLRLCTRNFYCRALPRRRLLLPHSISILCEGSCLGWLLGTVRVSIPFSYLAFTFSFSISSPT